MLNLMWRVSIASMAMAIAAYGGAGDSPQDKVAMQSMTVAQLEKAGDDSRAQKDYAQAIVYFKEGLRKDGKNAKLYNKLGLAELKSNYLTAARTDFKKAAKYNPKYPEPLNNMGAVYYVEKNYGQAAKYFKKAVALDETRASFHVNLGAAWFAQEELDRAIREYTRAIELDPDVLLRDSKIGVAAQITTPAERAKHDYMMAKVYAKLGNADKCLECLRKAKENGYRELPKVYKEEEFAVVWRDPRLAAIVPPPPVQ